MLGVRAAVLRAPVDAPLPLDAIAGCSRSRRSGSGDALAAGFCGMGFSGRENMFSISDLSNYGSDVQNEAIAVPAVSCANGLKLQHLWGCEQPSNQGRPAKSAGSAEGEPVGAALPRSGERVVRAYHQFVRVAAAGRI